MMMMMVVMIVIRMTMMMMSTVTLVRATAGIDATAPCRRLSLFQHRLWCDHGDDVKVTDHEDDDDSDFDSSSSSIP